MSYGILGEFIGVTGPVGPSSGSIGYQGVTGGSGSIANNSLEYKFGRTIAIDGSEYFNWAEWVEQLTRGDVVWLEKEKVFALIGSKWVADPVNLPTGPQGPANHVLVPNFHPAIGSYQSFFYTPEPTSELGQIAIIKSVTYTGGKCEFKEEIWRVRANGCGIDGSQLMKPLIGWTGRVDPPAQISSKEQELCEAIDALEKEIERLKSFDSKSPESMLEELEALWDIKSHTITKFSDDND